MRKYMLTTTNNPWNPYTQFDEWFAFDLNFGHNCLAQMMRRIEIPDNLTEEEQDFILDETCRDIAKDNFFGDFRLINKDGDFVSPTTLEIIKSNKN